MSFTIERRYIGTTEGTGLLDKWHIPWQQWHIYQTFETEKARDERLKRIVNGTGWHSANFEFRKGGTTETAKRTKKAGIRRSPRLAKKINKKALRAGR